MKVYVVVKYVEKRESEKFSRLDFEIFKQILFATTSKGSAECFVEKYRTPKYINNPWEISVYSYDRLEVEEVDCFGFEGNALIANTPNPWAEEEYLQATEKERTLAEYEKWIAFGKRFKKSKLYALMTKMANNPTEENISAVCKEIDNRPEWGITYKQGDFDTGFETNGAVYSGKKFYYGTEYFDYNDDFERYIKDYEDLKKLYELYEQENEVV